MVALKPAEQERFTRRPPPGIDVALVYGPDAGLVHERCQALVKATVADPDDPFQLVHLDGNEVAAHPERLAEEAGAIALFGTRKAIWVRVADKPIERAVKLVLEEPGGGNLVVVQAGELTKQSPLRTACEQSPRGAALPCFAEEAKDVARFATTLLKDAGLTIEAAATRDLVDALGEDRRQARSEIDKLILYMEPGGTVTRADVATIVVDAHVEALNGIVDAAFGGDLPALDIGLSRLFAAKTSPDAVLGWALRHALGLAEARIKLDQGTPAAQALRPMRLFWKREGVVTSQLKGWSSPALDTVIAELDAAMLRARQSQILADSVARSIFWRIARRASPSNH